MKTTMEMAIDLFIERGSSWLWVRLVEQSAANDEIGARRSLRVLFPWSNPLGPR